VERLPADAWPEMVLGSIGKGYLHYCARSDTSLKKGRDQLNWLNAQLTNLPKSTRFVFISLHHPPVADFQTRINVSHNPRPNEIELRDDLEELAPRMKAKIILSAGHIHTCFRKPPRSRWTRWPSGKTFHEDLLPGRRFVR
jgi:hypothetical protein